MKFKDLYNDHEKFKVKYVYEQYLDDEGYEYVEYQADQEEDITDTEDTSTYSFNREIIENAKKKEIERQKEIEQREAEARHARHKALLDELFPYQEDLICECGTTITVKKENSNIICGDCNSKFRKKYPLL